MQAGVVPPHLETFVTKQIGLRVCENVLSSADDTRWANACDCARQGDSVGCVPHCRGCAIILTVTLMYLPVKSSQCLLYASQCFSEKFAERKKRIFLAFQKKNGTGKKSAKSKGILRLYKKTRAHKFLKQEKKGQRFSSILHFKI